MAETLHIPERFSGDETAKIVQDDVGPTDYVQGRGADMVPSRVGTGELFLALNPRSSQVRGSLFTFTGVNQEGAEALLHVAKNIVASGQELTREAILRELQTFHAVGPDV